MLEPCSHELRGILDAVPSCLGLYVRALHHWLQGNLGVPAVEAQQHMLCHYLSQGMALLLESATNNLL
jgi:hypothetical protein